MVDTIRSQIHQNGFINEIEWNFSLDDLKRSVASGGVDVHTAHSFEKKTPLTMAAFSNRVDVLEYLLSCNADINSKDGDGYTPLHWAAITGDTATVEYLLSCNADPTIGDISNKTALELAKENNESELAALLESPPKKA